MSPLPKGMRYAVTDPHSIHIDRFKVGDTTYTITTDYSEYTMFVLDLDFNLKNPRSLRRVYRKLSQNIREFNKYTFLSESDPLTGVPWVGLSPEYEEWKREEYPPRKILQLNFPLKRSMTMKNHPDAIRDYDSHGLLFGTELDYAEHHERGIIVKDRLKLPPRPFMPPGRTIAQEFSRLMKIYAENNFDYHALQTGRRRGAALRSKFHNPHRK